MPQSILRICIILVVLRLLLELLLEFLLELLLELLFELRFELLFELLFDILFELLFELLFGLLFGLLFVFCSTPLSFATEVPVREAIGSGLIAKFEPVTPSPVRTQRRSLHLHHSSAHFIGRGGWGERTT